MKDSSFENFIPKIDSFSFKKCAPDWHINSEFVNGYDITYIVEGKAKYNIDGKSYDLGQGDLIFLTDGTRREAVTFPHNTFQFYNVCFSQLTPGTKSKLPVFPLTTHITLRRDIIDLFRELHISWSEQQEGYVMKTRALLLLIIHRFSELLIYNINSTPGDYRINKMLQIIEKRYAEKITVKELAQQVNLDEAYFGFLFKKETGLTVHQYINKIRIKNAEAMLQSGDYKIYEIADNCGFSDVVHFYKSFKVLHGFPPSRCLPKN